MDSSVSTWIALLKTGQEEAVQRLWERYLPQLVRLADNKLRGLSRRDADEEDVALSAFHAFFRGATSGRFAELHNRDDLWRTLVLITTAKAVDRRRYHQAEKRGGRAGAGVDELALLEEVVSQEPNPAFAAEVVDQCQALIHRLDDGELQQIALRKLEGYTNEELAQELKCSLRTVKRRVALIQRIWETLAAEA